MVLDVQVHDRPVNGGGEQVERVGGIAGDDDDVAVTGADERRDLAAGRLVGTGTHRGGISRATVHAGVQRQQLRSPVGHRAQRGRAGRIVQVHVAGSPARDNGDLQGGSDELGQGRPPATEDCRAAGPAIRACGAVRVVIEASTQLGDPSRRVRACPPRLGAGRVITRGTPPRRRVAGQQAGA